MSSIQREGKELYTITLRVLCKLRRKVRSMAVDEEESPRALGALRSHLVKVLYPVHGYKVIGVATISNIYKVIVR